VWLNSSYWSQCDSIYAAFCAAALYSALVKRPKTSLAFLGLAFSFKLQTLFFVPAFFVLFLAEKIKLRHIPIFFGTFALTALPAIILGMDPKRVFEVYVKQATQYSSSLNWNSTSIFALLYLNENDWPVPSMRDIGNLACVCAILFIIYFAYKYRDRLNDKLIFLFTMLFILVIPFLLPQMHDRYFYLADVFSIMFAVAFGRKIFVPILIQTASFAAYHNYLLGYGFIKIEHGAIAILIAIYFIIVELRDVLLRDDSPEPANPVGPVRRSRLRRAPKR
jgi:Gpi18-like mannosyltransferase